MLVIKNAQHYVFPIDVALGSLLYAVQPLITSKLPIEASSVCTQAHKFSTHDEALRLA